MELNHHLSEDSPIEAAELRQLIARIADSNRVGNDHRPRVRDIAETMDIDPAVVIEELRQLRIQKAAGAPLRAQKLAEVLEISKTPVTRKVSMAPIRRLIVASTLMFALMLTASWLIIQSASAREPAIRKAIEKENYQKHYAEMSSKERAAYEAKVHASR